MSFDPKTMLSPPSILFPFVGAVAGYFLSRGPDKTGGGWGLLAGALAGGLFNAASSIVALQSDAAQKAGASSFNANVGGQAIASIIGSKDTPAAPTGAPALPPGQAAAGNLVGHPLGTIVGHESGQLVQLVGQGWPGFPGPGNIVGHGKWRQGSGPLVVGGPLTVLHGGRVIYHDEG